MERRIMVHLSSWLVIAFVFFGQDVEAQAEVTSPNPTTPPPVQPIALFGADTDKDNMKGKIPWRIIPGGMPFNTDKDKYKPYVIYPPPKQWYTPNFGKPYINKDWDPPKKKDDVDKKKQRKELDDIHKSKSSDKMKTMDDIQMDRNKIMAFLSMPGYTRCLDGDKKFLDDKSECKRLKKNMAWANKGPEMGNYCWGGQCGPQKRPPWQPYSFIGGSFSSYTPMGPPNLLPPLDGLEFTYPNIPFPALTPQNPLATFAPQNPLAPVVPLSPLAPVAPLNPLAPVGPQNPLILFAALNPLVPVGPENPLIPFAPLDPLAPVGPQNPFAPIGPLSPYPQQPYLPPSPYQKAPKPFGYPYSYKNYLNPYQGYGYKPFFAKVDTETSNQELDKKKQESMVESLTDKPEQKQTVTEEPKNMTKNPILT